MPERDALSPVGLRQMRAKAAGILNVAEHGERVEENLSTWNKQLKQLERGRGRQVQEQNSLVRQRQRELATKNDRRVAEISAYEAKERQELADRMSRDEEARQQSRQRAAMEAALAEKRRLAAAHEAQQARRQFGEQLEQGAQNKWETLQAQLKDAGKRLQEHQKSREALLTERAKAYTQRRENVAAQLSERASQRQRQEREWRERLEERSMRSNESLNSSRLSMSQRAFSHSQAVSSSTQSWKAMLEEERRHKEDRLRAELTRSASRLYTDREEERFTRSERSSRRNEKAREYVRHKGMRDMDHEAHMVAISKAVDDKFSNVMKKRREDEEMRQSRVRKCFDVGSAMKDVEGHMLVQNAKVEEVRSELKQVKALPPI